MLSRRAQSAKLYANDGEILLSIAISLLYCYARARQIPPRFPKNDASVESHCLFHKKSNRDDVPR